MAKQTKGYAITKLPLHKPLDELVNIIASVEELPSKNCPFIVINFEELAAKNILYQLRDSESYQLSPVFYLGTPPVHHEQIMDGEFTENSLDKALIINDRLQLIKEVQKGKITDFERAIVSYMFVREQFILKGFLDYHSVTGFQFPLLDSLGFREEAQHYWYMLQSMESRKLIKHETLVDEIQSCPHCKSGLLNFKNCCPNCKSVHIATQSFIHCFSCGNVGPLSEFLRQEELICNRCHVKLRHIGIDYDKPMEDKICQDCHHFFFEATVNAVCMVCAQLSDPQDLQSKRLYEYRLARRGESFAKGIDQHLIVELSQFLKLIDLSIFMMIVKWQTILAKRYDFLSFSLLAFRVENEEEMISSLGSLKTEKLLQEFFARVRNLLRNSDLVSRDNKTILFFLPMTPLEGCNIIYERIYEFTTEQTDSEMPIKIAGGVLTSYEIFVENITADIMLTELNNRIASHD